MRTTDSKSSTESNRHTMSTGRRLHPCSDQNRSTAKGSTPRVAMTEPTTEGAACRVVVEHERGAATSEHPPQLAQARFAPGSEEVGPSRVDQVDARVRDGKPLRCAQTHRDIGETPGTASRACDEAGMWFDARHRTRVVRPSREVEATAAPDVEDVPSCPVVDLVHRGFDPAVGIDAPVLELVDVGMLPDVGAGNRSR